jgi:catechol 2,3-dioxygenase-like lactoylglutathione lyase family enzyme
MSNKPQFGFVVEYVKNVEEAKRFYVEVLGLEVERSHPTFVQFGSFAIAGDESLTGTEEPEVYWLVDDAEAAFNDLAQKTEIYRPLKQMAFGKVFGIKDPAGRPCFLLELAKDRPSRPVK